MSFAHREDAVQAAWVAFLSGGDPIQAVNTYFKRERRHESSEKAFTAVADRAHRDRNLLDVVNEGGSPHLVIVAKRTTRSEGW